MTAASPTAVGTIVETPSDEFVSAGVESFDTDESFLGDESDDTRGDAHPNDGSGHGGPPPPGGGDDLPPGGGDPNDHPAWNLLRRQSVTMTVLAQDPSTVDKGGHPVLSRLRVPADRLARGPRSHRFHVVDLAIGSNVASEPVVLHNGDPWAYTDPWGDVGLSGGRRFEAADFVEDPRFRAQNVFAIASHTLGLFEEHLGRPIPWASGFHHLALVPTAKVQANAAYSPADGAILFGWVPAVTGATEADGLPAVYTCLSFDIVAHEVSHAVLDGLRPRYTEPGLPDQPAFHEALADLVAMFSVFGDQRVVVRLLGAEPGETVIIPGDPPVDPSGDPVAKREQVAERRRVRAAFLKAGPLTGLAEEMGTRIFATAQQHRASDAEELGRRGALRRSVQLPPNPAWKDDPTYNEPHRRAEILVAALMQTFVSMWAGRLDVFRSEGGIDADRMAEEGAKSAQHLLGMLLRSLDYLPPIELEFADVVDSVVTSDRRLAPEDPHGYRRAVLDSFALFGIEPEPHRIVDEDAIVADGPGAAGTDAAPLATPSVGYPPDPDAVTGVKRYRYEHLNFASMRSSCDEVYQFIWNNSQHLGIDVRLTTRVERVLSSTRIGPDGLVVTEVLADYVQTIDTTMGEFLAHAGPEAQADPLFTGQDPATPVQLRGGGVLVFDQFGRYRLQQRKPILDFERQVRRMRYLISHGIRGRNNGFGASDGVTGTDRFAVLHQPKSEDAW